MKKIRKQTKGLITFTILLFGTIFYSCDRDIVDQGVYMYNAQVTSEETFIVSASNDTTKSIIAASSSLAASDLTVNFALDQNAFGAYNRVAGTAYKALPGSYCSLSGNSSVIKSGSNTSEPIQLIIKPIPEDAEGIEKGVEYAVAVSITGVSGNIPVLEASKTIIVVIQSPSYTNIDDANTEAEGIQISGPAGGWSISTNTESKPDYPTSALIDGKDGTPRFAIGSQLGFPQILTLDKRTVNAVKGFKFTPVYDYGAEVHNVYVMDVHTSNNGINWKFQGTWRNDKIAPGTSKTNPDYKYLKFLIPIKARFFKFTIKDGGGHEASFAEIYSLE